MLHFHGFHDRDLLAALDGVADPHVDSDDRARNGRCDGLHAERQGRLIQRRAVVPGALAMGQDRQRIMRIGFDGRRKLIRRNPIAPRMLGGCAQRREIVLDPPRMPASAGYVIGGQQIQQEFAVAGDPVDA
ncbi:MAG: hypothetical protein ABI619_04360, partial [Betaproteobacteria bacterium]